MKRVIAYLLSVVSLCCVDGCSAEPQPLERLKRCLLNQDSQDFILDWRGEKSFVVVVFDQLNVDMTYQSNTQKWALPAKRTASINASTRIGERGIEITIRGSSGGQTEVGYVDEQCFARLKTYLQEHRYKVVEDFQ